ncbi:MAG: nuclear transport factor 2 family protein [Acidimicrobiales bacterium]
MDERTIWEAVQRPLAMEPLHDYCEYVDRNDPATLVQKVFTEDGAFELGSKRAVIGHESLRRMFAKTLAAFDRTSHHLSNVRIGFVGEGAATASSYVYAWHQEVGSGRRVEVWGRYHDELRLTEQGWRIAVRRLALHGWDGWTDAPFELIERLPNPSETPSPTITTR